MKKRSVRVIPLLLIISVCGVIGYIIGTLIVLPKKCTVRTTVVCVPTGATYQMLTDSLAANPDIKHTGLIRRIAKFKRLDRHVKSGRYELSEGMTAVKIVDKLRSGDQSPVKAIFNNVRSLEQLGARLSHQIEPDSATLAAYFTLPETASRYDFTPEEFIGMFIPNTYQVWWNITPEGFTDRMKREYDAFWNESRTAKLKRTGLTAKEVMNLASIVYEETKVVEDMPVIAGVYINRLHRGIPLQACPTAKFACGDFTIRRVLKKHTEIDSPYNTYKHRGLPPGPICMPSIASIDAVLNYSEHNYLYFCAKEDFSGRHYFSRTLAEHNRYARRYAAALGAAGIR